MNDPRSASPVSLVPGPSQPRIRAHCAGDAQLRRQEIGPRIVTLQSEGSEGSSDGVDSRVGGVGLHWLGERRAGRCDGRRGGDEPTSEETCGGEYCHGQLEAPWNGALVADRRGFHRAIALAAVPADKTSSIINTFPAGSAPMILPPSP